MATLKPRMELDIERRYLFLSVYLIRTQEFPMTNLPQVLIKFQTEWVDFYRESLDFQVMVGSHTSYKIINQRKKVFMQYFSLQKRGLGLADIHWFSIPYFYYL